MPVATCRAPDHIHLPTAAAGRECARRESAAADEPDRVQMPAEGVFASVFAARHLAYVVSCSGCCVASLVVFFGFVAFVVMSRLFTSQSATNDKSFTARMLLPLWFFIGLVRRNKQHNGNIHEPPRSNLLPVRRTRAALR